MHEPSRLRKYLEAISAFCTPGAGVAGGRLHRAQVLAKPCGRSLARAASGNNKREARKRQRRLQAVFCQTKPSWKGGRCAPPFHPPGRRGRTSHWDAMVAEWESVDRIARKGVPARSYHSLNGQDAAAAARFTVIRCKRKISEVANWWYAGLGCRSNATSQRLLPVRNGRPRGKNKQ